MKSLMVKLVMVFALIGLATPGFAHAKGKHGHKHAHKKGHHKGKKKKAATEEGAPAEAAPQNN